MAAEGTKDIHEVLEELIDLKGWHRQAACRGAEHPEIFFPERGSGRPDDALSYCERCTVRAPCLGAALELSDHAVVGVWGGTSGGTASAAPWSGVIRPESRLCAGLGSMGERGNFA